MASIKKKKQQSHRTNKLETMSKILGLDLGTNSIGWAIIDEDLNKIVDFGATIFPNSFNIERSIERQQRNFENKHLQRASSLYQKRKTSKKTNPIIFILIFCSFLTCLLTFLNFCNWQFWLNISISTLITTLTLLNPNNEQ